MTTFADLGVDVPLFAADVRLAEGLERSGTCVLCGARGACLPLDEVAVACPACEARSWLGSGTRAAACPRCGAAVNLAGALIASSAEALRQGVRMRLRGCARCLAAGRWTQAHETERGTLRRDGQLSVTPRYATFQGERWLYCHERPMVYLGEWGRAEFEAERPGEGRALFAAIVPDVVPDQLDAAWEFGLASHGGESDLRVYVFRCQHCAALRTHTDTD